MKKICWLFIFAAAIASATLVTAKGVTLESAPPVVVKTVPVAGAKDVDPTLTEISVTYSKLMQDGSWSWSTWGEGSYPETTGKPRYLPDQRTCVLPVKLEPNKFYAIWLNSDKFKNFKDASGLSAVPYLLTFFTGRTPSGSASTVLVDSSGPMTWLKEAGIDLDKVDVQIAPLTQVMIEDLQPDGTSRYRNVNRSINRGNEPLENLRFMNSDLVNLQRITDVEGNPIPFTSVHRDRTFHYSARLPTPVRPGGTLIYGTEGTTTSKVTRDADLGAFTYRFHHSPASGVVTRRVELHRLPPGAQLLELSPNATKREVDGRLEVLIDELVQPRGSVTLAFRYRLPGAGAERESQASNLRTRPASQARPTRDNVIVEDLALRMLAAIRDKEDGVLKELSVDCVKGWRDAWPDLAFELRERFQQMTGKPFGLEVGGSLVDGNYAAVKCTGPKELEGKHLVLFFLKTEEGWRNSLIRNSPPETPLSAHLAYGVAEMQKNIDAAGK